MEYESAFAPGTKQKAQKALKEIWESYHPGQKYEETKKDTP